MADPSKNFWNRFMRYGVWHGRGYSNGWNVPRRRLTAHEKFEPGVDAHDNFVAKAHDLNEIIAEEQLRARLAAAGFADLDRPDSNGDWSVALKHSTDRVLDFDHYYNRAKSPEARQAVADAFMMYES